ncbi:LINE-1 reverse transcriptase homolog [Pelobates cultripes]|uniref:LINE-1 reverse transcriptase homolog n=1 Tax=Pelobates cultripes TaxID=61616 RepID=A0AAD1RBZ9_PELCU|nr:LINE-1 reverse transcriptase homolog [Pelobates cultripes]
MHNPSTKSKGVAILLSENIQFHLEAEEKDREGRYLFLKWYIGDSRVTLANLYLPNKGQKASLASLLKALHAFSEGTVIIRGDFNAPLDPRVDTSKGSSTIPDHVLRGIRTLPWRTLHYA